MFPKLKSVIVGFEILLLIMIIYLGITTQAKLNRLEKEQEKVIRIVSSVTPLLEKSSIEGGTKLSEKKIIMTLAAIEKFVRTTPLVECGNCQDHPRKN